MYKIMKQLFHDFIIAQPTYCAIVLTISFSFFLLLERNFYFVDILFSGDSNFVVLKSILLKYQLQ